MKTLVLVILSLLVVSCSNLTPEEKELVGQWSTNGAEGGPTDIKPTKIELEILPNHTYSYYTPALQGYGQVAYELIEIPAMHQYGKWRVEKSSSGDEYWRESGFWKACCICVTPEDRSDRGGCNPYTLEWNKLTTHAFPVPILSDIVYPNEWTRTK